ncbi:zf-HC2 domain-containing protein [Streptomyces sp. FXJ1.172]|uniref:zf-HC2 domain-containing protein n=1 Tax=Streptomyces sp. FXJ1.172 TaxID=710705 RepID=UPI0007CFE6B3|nr:zf-HC2 domain-containing protein [Streptomyces sp. FXJ1.172]WEO93952.1 zf-HC2 domain-containing protein [Streptomyces sp. FXJ1.172]
MRSQERHRDVGAYALGVLNEADAFRFEDHLMECSQCAAQVTEFGPAARQLLLYRRATPRFVHPMAQPGPRLLERLLGEVARRQRVRRRRLLYGLAASVVLAVAGPGLVAFTGHDEPAAHVTAATDPHTGVWAEVTTDGEDTGSRLLLRVKDRTGPHICRLVVVGRDGSEQVAGTWTESGPDAGTFTTLGASPLHPDEIARYDVRTTDGQPLVSLKAP